VQYLDKCEKIFNLELIKNYYAYNLSDRDLTSLFAETQKLILKDENFARCHDHVIMIRE